MRLFDLVLTAVLVIGCSATAPLPGASGTYPALTGPTSNSDDVEPIVLADLPSPESRTAAAGFDGARGWLNIDHELTLEELKGRVVVIDFWTSGCINCLHTIPTLASIENRFAEQPVVVLGVHSPKFDEEGGPERLRDAVRALGVAHPVAIDSDKKLWKSWGARAWPTVVVLDTDGRVLWMKGGEPDETELTSVVAAALAEGRSLGVLATEELRGLQPEPETDSALRYPGKILGLTDGRLAIADTGHHRVVLAQADGTITIVGTGVTGKTDGSFRAATFNWPQGMAQLGDALYVADTNNHAIRKIDLKNETVTTVAGTGQLGQHYLPKKPAAAGTFSLRSPWALLPLGDEIVVAHAGTHQLGILNLKSDTIRVLAGSGQESREDGELTAATFAQPSALATDNKEIFVSDSESSSIRAVDLKTSRVRTIVGKGLFDFGDIDGDHDTTRLQHPIGLAYHDGNLYVADSYNSKIKRIDPRSGATVTVFGGQDNALDEPAGLAFGPQGLWIADTNHHRILLLSNVARLPADAPNGPMVATVELAQLRAPEHKSRPRIVEVDPNDPVEPLGVLQIKPDDPTKIRIGFRKPSGTKINAEGPARITWVESEGLSRTPDPLRATGAQVADGFDLTLVPRRGADGGHLIGVLEVVICDEETARVCVPVRRTLQAEIVFTSDAAITRTSIPLPKAQ